MTLILKQSTSVDIRIGPFMDATDAVTPVTTITLAAADQAEVLKANGAATVAMGTGSPEPFVAVTGADGWYDYTVQTGDVDIVGEVVFVVQDLSVCLPVFVRGQVVEEAVFDAMYLAAAAGPLQATTAGRTLDIATTGEVALDFGSTIGTLDAAQFGADFLTSAKIADNAFLAVNFGADFLTSAKIADNAFLAVNFGADSISASALATDAVNEIARAIGIQTNTAFSDIEFLMVLSTDHVTPATGKTVTGERSIDAGAFVGVDGTIAEISDGIYQFDALAADLNGTVITFRFSEAASDDTFLTVKTVA